MNICFKNQRPRRLQRRRSQAQPPVGSGRGRARAGAGGHSPGRSVAAGRSGQRGGPRSLRRREHGHPRPPGLRPRRTPQGGRWQPRLGLSGTDGHAGGCWLSSSPGRMSGLSAIWAPGQVSQSMSHGGRLHRGQGRAPHVRQLVSADRRRSRHSGDHRSPVSERQEARERTCTDFSFRACLKGRKASGLRLPLCPSVCGHACVMHQGQQRPEMPPQSSPKPFSAWAPPFF